MIASNAFLLLISSAILQVSPIPAGSGMAGRRLLDTLFAPQSCRQHWQDDNTVGFECESEEICNSAKLTMVFIANCWGSCDDKKYYCKKSTLQTDHFFMSEGAEGPGCCIQ